jgi:predicted dinucleotide-binding enzyme
VDWTVRLGPLLAGQLGGAPLDVFIAGDDETAKAKVTELVSSGSALRAREAQAWARLVVS